MAAASSSKKPTPWLWLMAGAVAAVAVGYVAAAVNLAGWAPVGVMSLGVGLVLGLTLSALAAMTGTTGRRQLIAGTMVLALAMVAATHAWLYLDFCRQWGEARAQNAQLAMYRAESPWSPSEYFAHEFSPSRAVLWCVDAVLVVAAAVGTVVVWYRHRLQPPAPAPNPLLPAPGP